MKRIALLGSTGSVGQSALRVIHHLQDELQVVALAAHSSVDRVEEQIRAFQPKLVALFEEGAAAELRRRVKGVEIVSGREGLIAVATFPSADFSLFSMSGTEGLAPALAAIHARKEIGIANKELLVAAGELLSRSARQFQVPLLPIDSEHSALFQCLQAGRKEEVRRLILTASGGPFRGRSREALRSVSVSDALAHPNWRMGSKVSIDSSTLMNKAFEAIEARWLFDIDPSQIDIVVHPESLVHSLVEFIDGSLIAQISPPDMALPIQYALTYPKRRPGLFSPFDFKRFSKMTFQEPDLATFRCLALGLEALRSGRSYPCFLNAANEVLVGRFLRNEISWLSIGEKLDTLLSSHEPQDLVDLDAVIHVDSTARSKAGMI